MSATEHDHDHDHAAGPHAADPAHDAAPTYYERLTTVVMELLIEQGLFRADDVQRAIEAVESRSPADGARIVARAWSDPAFKARLLGDANAAVRELGLDAGDAHLVIVENTPAVHNVIVCTLCSCYPRGILGLPPAWYKSKEYRSRVVREPRAVLAEFGVTIPPEVTVRVHDSTANTRYLVLPMRPSGTESLDDTQLAALVGRDAMVGTGIAGAGAPSAEARP